jgi:hypothetical protein
MDELTKRLDAIAFLVDLRLSCLLLPPLIAVQLRQSAFAVSAQLLFFTCMFLSQRCQRGSLSIHQLFLLLQSCGGCGSHAAGLVSQSSRHALLSRRNTGGERSTVMGQALATSVPE